MMNVSNEDTIISVMDAAKMLGVSNHDVQMWLESGVSQSWNVTGNNRVVYKDEKDGSIRRRKTSNPLILIVEDDHTIQTYYQAVFELLLYKPNIEFAINGLEGLLKVQELNPSLLITDIDMPGIDGMEMVESIRESGSHANIHTVFATALSEEHISERGPLPGNTRCYQKPLNLDTVKSILKQANINNYRTN